MTTQNVAESLARLDAVDARLAAYPTSDTPTGLTDPDPPTGERWEAGQVWAHIAEFVPYWQRQAELVLAAPADEPATFGRTKTDEGRVGAIERDRQQAPAELMARVTDSVAALRDFVAALGPEAWAREGRHVVRGLVTVRQIVQVFELDHLEEHADQLDSLAQASQP